jgi:tetratricopeptide (TPR) repeat protein
MSDRLNKLLKILALDPSDAFTLYGIAQEYGKLGDLPNALIYYDRCLAADPAYCYAYYHKGKLLADHDREPEALATLKAGAAAAKQAQDAKALNEIMALIDSLE